MSKQPARTAPAIGPPAGSLSASHRVRGASDPDRPPLPAHRGRPCAIPLRNPPRAAPPSPRARDHPRSSTTGALHRWLAVRHRAVSSHRRAPAGRALAPGVEMDQRTGGATRSCRRPHIHSRLPTGRARDRFHRLGTRRTGRTALRRAAGRRTRRPLRRRRRGGLVLPRRRRGCCPLPRLIDPSSPWPVCEAKVVVPAGLDPGEGDRVARARGDQQRSSERLNLVRHRRRQDAFRPSGTRAGSNDTLCGPPAALTNRTASPGRMVSPAGSNRAFAPSRTILTTWVVPCPLSAPRSPALYRTLTVITIPS